eukprot:1187259-Prorocentrum_minimum.AAC.1
MLKFSNSNYRMVVVLFKALIVSPERDVFPLAFATAAWAMHWCTCAFKLIATLESGDTWITEYYGKDDVYHAVSPLKLYSTDC